MEPASEDPPPTRTHFPKTLQKLVSVREREDKIETARKGIKGCRTRESALLAECLSTVQSPGAAHSCDPSTPELRRGQGVCVGGWTAGHCHRIGNGEDRKHFLRFLFPHPSTHCYSCLKKVADTPRAFQGSF